MRSLFHFLEANTVDDIQSATQSEWLVSLPILTSRPLEIYSLLPKEEMLTQNVEGWVPPPPNCLVTDVEIPNIFNNHAANHIISNLGPANLERVGKHWWRWRRLGSVVRAEWVEMRRDFTERKDRNDPGTKVMFYVHGGAYYLGGSIGHGPQIQRHARK
jgi:acetyl esterase/lipase